MIVRKFVIFCGCWLDVSNLKGSLKGLIKIKEECVFYEFPKEKYIDGNLTDWICSYTGDTHTPMFIDTPMFNEKKSRI